MARCCCAGTWFNAPTIMRIRYGTSFNSRPAINAKPAPSPTVAMSGGSDHPVSHGEIARTIHPDGATRKAKPIAIAECGVDRTGASQLPMRRVQGRPCASAQKPIASARASNAVAIPVTSVVVTLVRNPG